MNRTQKPGDTSNTRRRFLQSSTGMLALLGAPRSGVGQENDDRLPAIDCHAHVFHDGVVPGLLQAMDAAGVESMALLSILYPGLGNLNAGTLAVKRAAPERFYAFGCIDYRGMTEPDWPDRAIEQLERCRRAGADGIKMLLGKAGNPVTHFSLNHPRMQPLYKWYAREQLPVIFHVGDVPHFWGEPVDPWSTSPEGAGWYAQSPNACPSPQAIRSQVDQLAASHPDVRFIFAHLAMPDRELNWLSRLLTNHPQVSADLSAPCTAGLLVRQRDRSRQFVERFAHQLCFGTDAIITPGRTAQQTRSHYTTFAGCFRSIFESADKMSWFFPQSYQGLGLSRDVQEKIFYTNFHRLAGRPRADISRPDLLEIIDDAGADLHALEGVPNDSEFDRLSKEAVLHREQSFASHGTIANTVYPGGTVSERYRTAALEMFQRVKRTE